MKKNIRRLFTLLCALVLIGMLEISAGAAENYVPGNVKGLKKSVSETSVTLKWSGVSKANGYIIYRVDGTNYRQVKKTSSRSAKISNLVPGRTYRYAVKAYRTVKKKTYLSTNYTEITVEPKILTPAMPTGIDVRPSGLSSVKIIWKTAKNASGYEIFSYDASKKTYTKLSTVKGTAKSWKKSGLSSGTTMTLAVRSFRSVKGVKVYSKYSKAKSATVPVVSEETKSIHGIYFTAKTKKKVTVFNYTKNKQQVLQQGTTVISKTKHPGASNITAYLSKKGKLGDKIKINGSAIQINGYSCDTKHDYSTTAKEEYVNIRNLSSGTNRLIWVNTYKCRTYVFKGSAGKWKLTHTFKCGIGTYEAPTPRGVFRIKIKYPTGGPSTSGKELLFFGTPEWGCTIHHDCGAGVRNNPRPVSHGCIRLHPSDLNTLYSMCGIGTTVFIN